MFISVLIPQRNAGASVVQRAQEVAAVLSHTFDVEVVIVDDGSAQLPLQMVRTAIDANPQLRLIELTPFRTAGAGVAAAISAGIRAARGDYLLAIDAGGRFNAADATSLLAGLSRADMVYARPRYTGWRKLFRRIARTPRWFMLGLETREPDGLFWAARAEALRGFDLARGMYRYLPDFIAARGFRVAEAMVECDFLAPDFHRLAWPNPVDLCNAWWLSHRWRQARVAEREYNPDIVTLQGGVPPAQHIQHRKSA